MMIAGFSLSIWTSSYLQLLLMCVNRQQQNAFCNGVLFKWMSRLSLNLNTQVWKSLTYYSFSSLLHISKSLETQGTSSAHLREPLFSHGLRCETPKSESGFYFALQLFTRSLGEPISNKGQPVLWDTSFEFKAMIYRTQGFLYGVCDSSLSPLGAGTAGSCEWW